MTSSGSFAIDGNPTTVWQTLEGFDLGTSAILELELGTPTVIDRVELMPAQFGLLGDLAIETSIDGNEWAPFADPDIIPPDSDGWISIPPGANVTGPVTAKYVRVVAVGGNGEVVLGGVAEIEIWPPAP